MDKTYRNSYKQEDWQKAQFDLLIELDRFCTQHDIKYSLDFGSMLGAIRHRGYIPWDNDIDICMLQSEYDRFLEIVRQGDIPEGCALLDPSLDPEYQQAFGRIVDTRTTCMLSRIAWTSPTNGLFVDIFALRPLPRDEKKMQRAITAFLVYDEYLCSISRRAGNRTPAFKKLYAQVALRDKIFGRKKTLEWIRGKADSHLSESDPEWYLINSGGWYNGFAPRKAEWVNETVRVPVNGHMLPVFKGYLEILRSEYGDGWRHRPNGNPSFSPYNANLNIPGNLLVEDYSEVIDRADAVATFRKDKRLAIADMYVRNYYSSEAYRSKGLPSVVRAKRALEGHIDLGTFHTRHGETGEAFLKDARKVEEAFRDFFDVQTGERYGYWNVAIPMDGSWLAAAIWALLVTREDYWTAKKFSTYTGPIKRDWE